MKNVFILILFILINVVAFGQRQKPHNLPKLDQQAAHFGYSLGLNTMDFVIRPSGSFLSMRDSLFVMDTVYAVEVNRYVGFNINMIANLRLTDHLNVRFMPGLLFGQRNLDYKSKRGDEYRRHSMMIESTFLDFPLMLKYKSVRVNNFRPYIIAGSAFRVDMAAQRRIRPEERPKIRLKPVDVYYEVGIGTDFFLEYFMFAVELKASWGITNNVVYDNTQYTNYYNRLNSRIIMLSFHFEGGKIDKIAFWK